MTRSTIEQAFIVARSGQAPNLAELKRRLHADGFRAVDALLASRNLGRHLEAICVATFRSRPTSDETADPQGI